MSFSPSLQVPEHIEQISLALSHVESLLNESLTDHELETNINAFCNHVISAGGKRVRPRLVLLSAFALPNFEKQHDLEHVEEIAAAVELLHTATLVHDDVIDKATMRRGVSTLNDTEGNHAAVLVGDYLFTRSFDYIHRSRNFDIMMALNHTLRQLVIGELYQYKHEGDLSLEKDTYFRTIYAKTGVLFELSASAPCLLVADSQRYYEPLKTYGRKLGVAFQIKDDMLDYSAQAQELGKDPGIDLNDQRITLPVLLALENIEAGRREHLLEAIKAADIDVVRQAIHRTKALELCEQCAQESIQEAIASLEILEENPYKQELVNLCNKVLNRNS